MGHDISAILQLSKNSTKSDFCISCSGCRSDFYCSSSSTADSNFNQDLHIEVPMKAHMQDIDIF